MSHHPWVREDTPGLPEEVDDRFGRRAARVRSSAPGRRASASLGLRRSLRSAASVLLTSALSIAVLAPVANAEADDLTSQRERVAQQITQTQLQLNESTRSLSAAAVAVQQTQGELKLASGQLAATREELAKARTRETALAAQLRRTRAELRKASAAVAAGLRRVNAQSARAGDLVRNQYQQQTNLLSIAVLVEGDSTADLQTKLQWSTTMFDTIAAEVTRLETMQLELDGERARQTGLERQVAEQRQAAATNLAGKQALEAQAAAQEAEVASRLLASQSAQQAAAQEVAADRLRYAEQNAERAAVERRIATRIAEAKAAAARKAAVERAARIAAEQRAARIAAEQRAARIAAEQRAARIAAEQRAARIAAEQRAAAVAAEQRAEREAARAARQAAEAREGARRAEEQAERSRESADRRDAERRADEAHAEVREAEERAEQLKKAAQEKAAQEKAAQEKAAQEKAAQEKAAQEKAAHKAESEDATTEEAPAEESPSSQESSKSDGGTLKSEHELGSTSKSATNRSDGEASAGNGFSLPVPGPITSPYGMRLHPILRYWKLHDGTDFRAGCGTPIRAPFAGRVAERYYNAAYGNRLMIDHGLVDGRYVTTGYNHSLRYTVSVGDRVKKGEVIGYAGTTGYSTGCHLHLMVWLDGKRTNPMTWF